MPSGDDSRGGAMPSDTEHCLAQHLTDGGMREYRALNVADAHVSVDHHCAAVDYLGGVCAYHVNAENVLVLASDYQLDNTVSALVLCDISAAELERYGLDDNVQTLSLCALLGLADRSDLGICIYDRRNG